MWYYKTFQDLTKEELFLIYKERLAVFVVEQACPYQEVDDLDLSAIHLFKMEEQKLQAYCRLIPDQNLIKLGRVLVPKNFRQEGLGQELVSQALDYCQEHFPDRPVFAQAQAYLEDFYASFGFSKNSASYLEDGIPHIDMLLTERKKER